MLIKVDIKKTKKEIRQSPLKLGGTNPQGDRISFTNYYMELNRQPFFGICGEFHYARYPYPYWDEEILKIKMSGVNILATYIFWIHHEEEEGSFTWENDKNLRYFVELCRKHDLYVFLRIGPFSHGECRNGGFPDWLYGRPFDVRSNDERYLAYVDRFYSQIYRQVFDMFYKDGGPVIGVQLENEYMHAGAPWEMTVKHGSEFVTGGKEGTAHMKKLKELAVKNGFDVPIYTSTGWGGAPVLVDEILPLYGGYAFCPWNVNDHQPEQPPTQEYIFTDYHNNSCQAVNFQPPYPPEEYPFACCEMGSGMQVWYQSRFIVPPESVTALTLQKVAGGCNFIGYYMFHGGSQPVGKQGFLNENVVPQISYDFQAPIGEYGQIKASYLYLKNLFLFFHDFAEVFCRTVTVLPENQDKITARNTETLRFALRVHEKSGFIFINNYQDHVNMQEHKDVRFNLNLANETLTIPEKNTIRIKKDISLFFPFNFNLEGINLRYATVQPITRMMDNQIMNFFFFEPDGITGEYCFEAKMIKQIETKKCRTEKNGPYLVIYPEPGQDCMIELTSHENTMIRIYTLPLKESLGLYKVKLWGRDRMILTSSNVAVFNDQLTLTQSGDHQIHFTVYPPVNQPIAAGTVPVPGTHNPYYSSFSIKLPERKINLQINNINRQEATVKLSADDFRLINDIFLQIDYEGDIGKAFINGLMINDNFYNGQIWEIGLKRFFPKLANNEIYLYIVPQKKGKLVSLDSAMAVQNEFIGDKIADIRSINAVPEYKTVVRLYSENPD